MTNSRKIKVAIAGLGTVGQGVWKHLRARRKELESSMRCQYSLERAAVRDLSKKRAIRISQKVLTDDAMSLANDPEIDVLCELMGGTDEALKVTKAALKNGKTVVSANKALLCDHGDALFRLAKENGAHIYFEASVAGGIPIIKALREGLVVNQFPQIYGILNGTCNYILTRMEREMQSFETILQDARRLGYVEADESLDLDGWDAAHKAVIIAYLAHGKWIPLKKMPVEGIREITLEDIQWAQRLGYKIKLLALILRDFKNDHLFASVQPALVPSDMILANVDGVFNAISVTGDIVGESVYIGRGAGQDATASAVISDVVDAVTAISHGIQPEEPVNRQDLKLARLEDVYRSFYIRLSVKDQPGVLAEVANILSKQDISIESVMQQPNGTSGSANLVLTTHVCSEAAMASAVAVLKRHRSLLKKPFLLRIADFAQRLG
ncbi:homoserine dehydrogenase [Puniceicoccales bacterium CK1056]|uniref:Homoserine dehydrogenase n=1 Tax=Oceanipulchritudo coccoides TaxID=2706888 RepID=A0A6B2M097_9BACT|nr:homoserine dehydrogenase [Oceanipulchritudo coccoides]NDV61822.1 homoserine dehydrogenase [Oceanipulchritudo coccoides]